MIDWTKVSDNEQVIFLFKLKMEIEERIREIDEDAMFRFAQQVLEDGGGQ